MSAKDTILERLRSSAGEKYAMPDLKFTKTTYASAVDTFKETAVTVGGAKVIELSDGDDINAAIRGAYPEAKVISSNVPGVKADRNPDTVATAQELDGTDVGVVLGEVACAENACIWVPQTMKERAVCFISENLVIIIDRSAIVSNMHEAYAKIKMPESGFGTFISGPSKTADIEQALVYGAQASKGVTIIIR